MVLLPIHIAAGIVALISGFIAIFAIKGMKVHRASGKVFLYAMLTMASMGVMLAIRRSQPGNVVGGSVAFYMVLTGVLALRRRDDASIWIDAAGVALGIGIIYFSLDIGLRVLHSASGKINGLPPTPLFVFAVIIALSVLGDVRMMFMHGLQGRHRLVRHLWRMSFSLFIASGSFFLGQAKVIPKPIRILPLLAIPALLPLVLMLYWVARVALTKWYRRRGAGLMQASPSGG